ncbi:MAG: asparagine synthase-related protein [Acidobacteriota bacterium]
MGGIWGVCGDFGPQPASVDVPQYLRGDGFRSGSSQFRPESPQSVHWRDSINRIEIVGNIVLHNSRDLVSSLGLSPDSESTGDLQLVVASYRKWGTDCCFHLTGEFRFAIWDEARRQLLLSTDHFSSFPLCYWHRGGLFAFASDPRLLMKIAPIPRQLNRGKLANMAVLGGQDFVPDETMHAGIRSVPPASCLIFREEHVQSFVFWEPGVRPVAIPKREDEAFEALRELLFASVRNRIRGAGLVTSMLSGGLDSSVLTAIASRCLERENRSLVALAAVVPEPRRTEIRDEREFIDEFRGWPNVRIEYINAPGKGPFDEIFDLARFETSFMRSSRYYLSDAIESAALAQGSEVMLNGQYGELGATASGRGHYLDLAAGFGWFQLVRELIRRPSDSPPLSCLTVPQMLASECRDLLFPRPRKSEPIVFLADDFRKECAASAVPGSYRADHRQAQTENIRSMLRKHATRLGAAALSRIRTVYPFTDRRVLDFCLAAPGAMKVRGGYPRYLVRGALGGLLPRNILWRKSKTPFAPDYFVRYNAQLHMAREFVGAIGPKDPVRTIVDVSRLSQLLRPVDEVRGTRDALARIPASIYLIAFLRQFPEFR